MQRQKLVTRLASATAVATLALGAVACESDGNADLEPGQEAPEGDVQDGGGLEGEGGGLEGEGGGLEEGGGEGGDF